MASSSSKARKRKTGAQAQKTPDKRHALWNDAHRPTSFDELTFHARLDAQLEQLAEPERRAQLPNVLFYGPRGGGKRTRVHALLRALYRIPETDAVSGATTYESAIDSMSRHQMLTIEVSRKGSRSVSSIKSERRVGEMIGGADDDGAGNGGRRRSSSTSGGGGSGSGGGGGGGRKRTSTTTTSSSSSSKRSGGSSSFDVACVMSPYHLEVTPSDAARKDLHVIRNCVRHLCQATRPPISLFSVVDQDGNVQSREQMPAYRVIVINRADYLTWEAQAAMRRTMEQYAKRVRFVLICEQASRIVDALRSRCLLMRVPRPESAEAHAALERIAGAHGIVLAPASASVLLERTNTDMTFAVSAMQHNHSDDAPFHLRSDLKMPDWHRHVELMSGHIFRDPNLEVFQAVRRTIYELLSRCVPTARIVQVMLCCLLRVVDTLEPQQAARMRPFFVRTCAFFEARIAKAFRPIVHLDALAAHLREGLKRERLGLPSLDVTNDDDPFPRASPADVAAGAIKNNIAPPISLSAQEMSTLHRQVDDLAL